MPRDLDSGEPTGAQPNSVVMGLCEHDWHSNWTLEIPNL